MLDELPEVEPRYRRLNVEEPYRLFLTCVDIRLQLTAARVAGASRTARAATTATTPS